MSMKKQEKAVLYLTVGENIIVTWQISYFDKYGRWIRTTDGTLHIVPANQRKKVLNYLKAKKKYTV